MNVENLIKMANQIGSFFETMPDRPQAMTDFSMHIKRFWEPRMRNALLKYAEQQEGNELKEIVRESIRVHADAIR
ncbi:formate dehydrogenase subunit delta [Glaciimonas sp. PCH181]|uniref:formate dehydrogenase subunit delta n=1 Tax=Glaciimonas sp. PCH181 TaxID=2133943 RepID=UPI000D347FBF|nr:formate dehydrogenase subunit delta [Glaciimonas sp. PCH181]PUA17091.1 formate dehydrogenase [Glaciimonas sp. PCH181]